MHINDFDYFLPKELIAQYPADKRDESRLLIFDRNKNIKIDDYFKNIKKYLDKNSILVVNETKVFPARLFGKKENEAKIEIFLLHNVSENIWDCLVKPGKKIKEGDKVYFSNNFYCEIIDRYEDGCRKVKFSYEGDFWDNLNKYGLIPLPPYIDRKLEYTDKERYQTIYAKKIGAVAAPTAGLHFTEELINDLKNDGFEFVPIVLHVGIGTFRPVKVENIKEHKMHKEYYEISKESAEKINSAKINGKKIIAVGTTSVRTLETAADENGLVKSETNWSDIFIYPGYKFKVIDGMITNFHLPKSTLLMLVSAFAGRENILNLYNYAIEKKYRFFSYGDAMLLK